MRLYKFQIDKEIDQLFRTVGNLERRRIIGMKMIEKFQILISTGGFVGNSDPSSKEESIVQHVKMPQSNICGSLSLTKGSKAVNPLTRLELKSARLRTSLTMNCKYDCPSRTNSSFTVPAVLIITFFSTHLPE